MEDAQMHCYFITLVYLVVQAHIIMISIPCELHNCFKCLHTVYTYVGVEMYS